MAACGRGAIDVDQSMQPFICNIGIYSRERPDEQKNPRADMRSARRGRAIVCHF
jgi:hypothetical protein